MLMKNVGLNKCYAFSFACLILSMIKSQSVNLHKNARVLDVGIQEKSLYRRYQRFFLNAVINFEHLTKFLLYLMFKDESGLTLMIDRTNWFFGVKDENGNEIKIKKMYGHLKKGQFVVEK